MLRYRAPLASLLLVVLGLAAPAAAQTTERCFVETGFCISGSIRAYWERNGGLPVFGYPITAQRTETVEGTWTGPVQWFERDRLEDHSNEHQGVLTGRLGAVRFQQLYGQDWQQLPGDAERLPGCRFFPETSFNVCEPFLSYWERNGGLERFGYPIARPRTEAVAGQAYTVQYFERRRLEHHPEHAGTPYEVLLGLLGREVLAAPAWFVSPPPPFAPLAPATYHRGAAQRFEHGFLLWTEAPDAFYMFVEGSAYWIAPAPYTFQAAPPVDEAPPPGRYAPVSGFGRLWRGEIANLGPGGMPEPPRTLLGWAVEAEHAYTTEYQCHGGAAYSDQRCYLRGPSGEVIWFGPAGWGRWP